MKYFHNINSVEQLKKQYKTLCKKYHPDLNKDTDTTEAMKAINAEYEKLFARYKDIHETADGDTYTAKESTTERSEDFINIINAIISFNIDIEIIGSWVWCFNSFEYREQLKALGFKFAAKKKAWVWHSGEHRAKRSNMALEAIREKYGSEKIRDKADTKKLAYA